MSLSAKTKSWLRTNAPASLAGKTVLITGSNSGVGFKAAETMVYLGASVIMACRSAEKAERARENLLRDYPEADIRIMRLDLASLRSIEDFAEELSRKGTDIDVFVNNAGTFHHPGERTEEGFDLVMGTNYLGTYYLTEQVVPCLLSLPHPVLLVNTVSIVIKTAREIDYTDFYCARRPGNLRVYGRSKLCLARYTYALAKRLKDTNVRVQMSHPGIAVTPLGLNAFGRIVNSLAKVGSLLFNSPEKSSLALPYLMANNLPVGSLAGPSKLFGGWGYPRVNRLQRRIGEGTERLIEFTEAEIVKLKY